jgi:SAM-dependent methyltransferase
MSQTIEGRVWREFEHQADYPPGSDPVIAACYRAVGILAASDEEFQNLIEEIYLDRGMEEKHMVNLFFRAVQYIMMFEEGKVGYSEEYASADKWDEELRRIYGTKKESLVSILENKDTGTTLYQRYAGPKAIISSLWPEEQVSVLDLGCGGNHGLPGIICGETFAAVKDHTFGEVVSRWIAQPVSVGLAVGIDKHDPYNEEAEKWRAACSFYPSELSNMPGFVDFEARIKDTGAQRFFQADITRLNGNLPVKTKFDTAILSTVLYQLSVQDRENTIKAAQNMLKKDGVLIVQDFARRSDSGTELDFNGSWFGEDFSYRTFVRADWTEGRYWEIMRWKNGRCKELKEGEDFERYVELVNNRNRMEVITSVN